MSQSDYNIANDSAPAVRAKLNTVFESIATNNAGASAPSTTFPHQWWYDGTTNILKQRNAADDAWIDIGQFDQSAGTFQPIGTPQLTQVQVEDDTDTTFGTVSGERLAQAVVAHAPGVTTSEVLSATAAASEGAVGTYVFARRGSNTSFGSTTAGSNLNPTGAVFGITGSSGSANNMQTNSSLSGTWRCMGRETATQASAPDQSDQVSTIRGATLWLRIA
jgi:hypothetical protein